MVQGCRSLLIGNVPGRWLTFHYDSIQVDLIQMDDNPADSCVIIPTTFLLNLWQKGVCTDDDANYNNANDYKRQTLCQ